MTLPTAPLASNFGLRLDRIDLKILRAVARDGRITKLALAAEVGLSPTPCWLRLRKLEDCGLIAGWHAELALRQVMPITRVIVEVMLSSHRQADFKRFESAVGEHASVAACWAVGGRVDYFMVVIAPDIEAYQDIIDGLLDADIGIDRYFTHVITREVKHEKAAGLAMLEASLPPGA